MHPLILVDGICCQLAGELIFDSASTFAERRAHQSTYLRSLEDIAFLILFSPRLGVGGTMPAMRNDHPGNTFLDYVALLIGEENVLRSTPSTFRTPAHVLRIESGRTSTKAQLRQVGRAFRNSKKYWHDVLRREAMSQYFLLFRN